MRDVTLKLKSSFTVVVRGERPERFLNAAAAKGIYVSEVRQIDGGLRLRLSLAACRVMEKEIPQGLNMKPVREHGAPKVLRRFKRRYLLLGGGAMFMAALIAFSQFVWRLEISGGSPELQAEAAAFLEEQGIRPGILKSSINQNDIKREAILAIDDLMWLWVDLQGTTAYVRLADRRLPPESLATEPGNVIACETGVVEQLTVLDGKAVVGELETVEKGSVLISGIIPSDRIEKPIIRHARGRVIARVWRDKTVTIPKTIEKRDRTGEAKNIKSIKIKKFIVNFSLNSSILYPKYDRIRTKYRLGPIELINDEYAEVETETETVDTEAEAVRIREEFEQEILGSGAELVSVTESRTDLGDRLELSMTAECLADIAMEMPM